MTREQRRGRAHSREMERASCRRLLARGRLLGVVVAAPALALGWVVASRPERAVGAVIADPLVQSFPQVAGTYNGPVTLMSSLASQHAAAGSMTLTR